MGARNTALALLAALAVAALRAELPVPQLRLEAPSELQGVASQLARMDLGPSAALAAQLGLVEPGLPIRVVLTGNDSALGQSTPAWIAGFAAADSGTIVLFPSRSPSYPYESIEDVLRHEIAHVLIARAARGADVPRWLHEGLAMSAEQRGGLRDQTYLTLAWMTWRGGIGDLDREFEQRHGSAARAYAVSHAFVRDLLARHGADLPRHVLARLAVGDSIDEAIAASTGLPLAAVEREFWRGRWWYYVIPVATSSLMLWMVITLLALYAIRRRLARRAELRQRWEREELEAGAAEIAQKLN